MISLYDEESQRELISGPVPAGSKVMLRMTVERPQYATQENEFISSAKSGLRSLWVKFEVSAGAYEGVSWRESVNLPASQQKISLSDGQKTACSIGGRLIKAIVQAARNVNPKDDTPKAKRALELSSWLELNGMNFPARLAIADVPYTGKDGREYWNNKIGLVITPDKDDYSSIRQGKEHIAEGPTCGEGKAKKRDSAQDDPGWDSPPASAYDDPF